MAESYGKIPRKEWLQALVALYPELLDLQLKVDSSPERRNKKPNPQAASETLFGEGAHLDGDYSEFDATISFIELLLTAKRGDYAGFVGSQPEAVRLKPSSFELLSEFVNRLTPTPEHLDAAIVGAVLHDLGKIKLFGELVSSLKKELFTDHDEILFHAISSIPIITRSNTRLRTDLRNLNIASFNTGGFELPQLVQGENLAFHCQNLPALGLEAFDWMSLRSIFDAAGAAGGQSPLYSPIMIEPVFQIYWKGYRFVREKLEQGLSGREIYREYLRYRGEELGFDMTKPIGFAQTRIALWNRITKEGADTELVAKAFESLPAGARAVLVDELNADGIETPATFLYYSPGFSIGFLKSELYKSRRPLALEDQLRFIFQLMFKAQKLRAQEKTQLLTVNLNELASVAEKNPERLFSDNLTIEKTDAKKAEPKLTPYPQLTADGLREMSSLAEIPGKNVIIFTIGGGSDILRADEVVPLFEAAGKKVLALASIVRWEAAPSSRFPDPKTRWVINNHGGKIFDEVFRILPETTSPTASSPTDPYARFFEPIAAKNGIPTFRIHLSDSFSLAQQAQSILNQLPEKPNLILFLDSGGDSLEQTESPYASTTRQDGKVLQLLQPLKAWNPDSDIKTLIVSPGIDAPLDIGRSLTKHHAAYYKIRPEEAERIANARADLQVPFSRMTDAWRKSLQGVRGWLITALPRASIENPNGQGNPLVYLHDLTPSYLLLDYAEHLKLIGASEIPAPPQPNSAPTIWALSEEIAQFVEHFDHSDRRASQSKFLEQIEKLRAILGEAWIPTTKLSAAQTSTHVIGAVIASSWSHPGESVEIFEGLSLGSQNIADASERPFFATLIQTRDGRRIELTEAKQFTIFTKANPQ